jgi:hypothetical protein
MVKKKHEPKFLVYKEESFTKSKLKKLHYFQPGKFSHYEISI